MRCLYRLWLGTLARISVNTFKQLRPQLNNFSDTCPVRFLDNTMGILEMNGVYNCFQKTYIYRFIYLYDCSLWPKYIICFRNLSLSKVYVLSSDASTCMSLWLRLAIIFSDPKTITFF